jgi:inorganic triphosphatase YgiF
MSRGKAISVKIPTKRVIAGLEASLAKLEANYATQEASEAKYEKAMEKWRKELQEFAIANIKKAENFRTNYRSYNNRLNIDYDIIVANGKELPTEPEREYELLRQHEYREQKEEMMNAIRILKMTDEETVSTSTYQAVARYL